MNNKENYIFAPIVAKFKKTIADLNAEIVTIQDDRRYSDDYKRERVAEVNARKGNAFEVMERELMAKVAEYEPKYDYKPLPLEALNKISALLNIARANGRAIDDRYLMTLLRDYVAEYDLLELASTFPRMNAFPECFKKEMDYLSKVEVFEAFRAEIVECAKTRQEASYNWERLKLMNHYNGMPF